MYMTDSINPVEIQQVIAYWRCISYHKFCQVCQSLRKPLIWNHRCSFVHNIGESRWSVGFMLKSVRCYSPRLQLLIESLPREKCLRRNPGSFQCIAFFISSIGEVKRSDDLVYQRFIVVPLVDPALPNIQPSMHTCNMRCCRRRKLRSHL